MNNKISLRIPAILLSLVLIFSAIPFAFAADNTNNINNVIVMIGDGMGVNTLKWTEKEMNTELFMKTLPCQGYSQTDSLSGLTDSAAGGSALSCGLHNFNSNIGTLSVLMNGYGFVVANYKSTTEVAQSLGKRTGIVTSDENSGATPGSFSAHTTKRELAEEITAQQLASDIDLIWAHSNGLVDEKRATEAGKVFCDSLDDIKALKDGEKSFAAIDADICYDNGGENDIPLSTLTTLAINKLKNDKGFFLMVEGAHIDKNSHNNIKEGMMKSVLEFDKAIKNAVDFAKEDGHTLIIITADHETGGITYNEEKGDYEYTIKDHSNADVPVFVYGSDELVTNGTVIVNTEVAKFTAKKLGYTGKFPAFTINAMLVPDFFKALFALIKGSIG